jgi:hypothetical protein
MLRRRWTALFVLGGWLLGCGVRGNPRPPLPDVRPPPASAADAGTADAGTADAGH